MFPEPDPIVNVQSSTHLILKTQTGTLENSALGINSQETGNSDPTQCELESKTIVQPITAESVGEAKDNTLWSPHAGGCETL